MRLKLLLPTQILVDEEVDKVIAEAENGSFCLLPRHVDFVAGLVPGLLSFVKVDGQEEFVAVDRGILVKCGSEVMVSTRDAMRGPDLETLQRTIDDRFQALDEHEKMTLTAVGRLEANFIRRFIEVGERDFG